MSLVSMPSFRRRDLHLGKTRLASSIDWATRPELTQNEARLSCIFEAARRSLIGSRRRRQNRGKRKFDLYPVLRHQNREIDTNPAAQLAESLIKNPRRITPTCARRSKRFLRLWVGQPGQKSATSCRHASQNLSQLGVFLQQACQIDQEFAKAQNGFDAAVGNLNLGRVVENAAILKERQ